MRKIKVNVQFAVPSWNYCNKDIATSDGRFQKELCKFCIKTTGGYYCQLHEEYLANDRTFVYKPEVCKDITAATKGDIVEPDTIHVDPQVIIREAVNTYKKTLADLHKQGYPAALAEKIATDYMFNNK